MKPRQWFDPGQGRERVREREMEVEWISLVIMGVYDLQQMLANSFSI